MAVRYLAQELYRLSRRVEELESALAEDRPAGERARLEAELRTARGERDRFRAMLEAKKEKPLV